MCFILTFLHLYNVLWLNPSPLPPGVPLMCLLIFLSVSNFSTFVPFGGVSLLWWTNKLSWGCMYEHGWGIIYRSMGNVSVTIWLKSAYPCLLVCINCQRSGRHGTLWALLNPLRTVARPSLVLSCKGDDSVVSSWVQWPCLPGKLAFHRMLLFSLALTFPSPFLSVIFPEPQRGEQYVCSSCSWAFNSHTFLECSSVLNLCKYCCPLQKET